MTLPSEPPSSDGMSDRAPIDAPSVSRVLVVGGRGFVGSHIVRALLAHSVDVHVFGPAMADDLLADLSSRFVPIEGSVEDRSAVSAAIDASGAEAVVTAAAFSEGRDGLMRSSEGASDRALAVNVIGLRNVFEAAREAGLTRVVWTASTVVYGAADAYPAGRVDETAARAPMTFYGLTKVLGEDVGAYYRRRYGMQIVGLRLPLILGEGLWYAGAASALASVVAAARPGAHHEVSFHDEPMDLMHVADVGRAVLAVLGDPQPAHAVYNINGFTARMSEVIEAARALVPGYAVEHTVSPPAITFPLIDDRRFREETQFAPAYGLDEVVRSTLVSEEQCTKSD